MTNEAKGMGKGLLIGIFTGITLPDFIGTGRRQWDLISATHLFSTDGMKH